LPNIYSVILRVKSFPLLLLIFYYLTSLTPCSVVLRMLAAIIREVQDQEERFPF
jgi:hypothetical protein